MGRRFEGVSIFLGILLALLIVFPIVSSAQEVITNRSGTIRITTPEGTVLTVTKDQPLPAIPSGSTIEILEGKADISPTEGFVKVIVSGSAAIIGAGDIITTSLDSKTGTSDFAVVTGEIEVISGNTIVKLNKGQETQINFDKTTGVAEIKSIKGEIETVTVGIKTLIMQGAVARINADPKTRMVHVKSTIGELHVTSIDGKVFRVTEGESMETEGSAIGEIQTFGEGIEAVVPEEEPVEPERPEASPHRP
jgi:hypothetical protein